MKNLFSTFFKLGLLLLPQLTASAGSYLYCVNPKVKGSSNWEQYKQNPWGWAKGKDSNLKPDLKNDLERYKDFTYRAENGTWISGTASYADYNGVTGRRDSAHQAFLLMSHVFNNRAEADSYCKTLEKTCQNDYGEDYSHVGVSSWDIPQSTWASIAVSYKSYKLEKGGWIACTQKDNTGNIDYTPLGTTVGYGIGALMMGIACGIACLVL